MVRVGGREWQDHVRDIKQIMRKGSAVLPTDSRAFNYILFFKKKSCVWNIGTRQTI